VSDDQEKTAGARWQENTFKRKKRWPFAEDGKDLAPAQPETAGLSRTSCTAKNSW